MVDQIGCLYLFHHIYYNRIFVENVCIDGHRDYERSIQLMIFCFHGNADKKGKDDH